MAPTGCVAVKMSQFFSTLTVNLFLDISQYVTNLLYKHGSQTDGLYRPSWILSPIDVLSVCTLEHVTILHRQLNVHQVSHSLGIVCLCILLNYDSECAIIATKFDPEREFYNIERLVCGKRMGIFAEIM